MRIQRLQTLVWIGDVLVVVAAAWCGGGLVRAMEVPSRGSEPVWPEVAETSIPSGRPDDGTDVDALLKSCIDGFIPKPPEEDEPPRSESPDIEFRRRTRITGGIFGSSETTSVQMTFDAQPRTLRLGESIDAIGRSWQLVDFVRRKAGGVVTAHFHAADVDVSVTQESSEPGPLTRPAFVEFVPAFEEGGPIDPDRVRADRIGRRAYFCDRTEEWTVTAEEVLWWRTFGESEFFAKLVAETVTGDDGKPRGLRLLTVPSPAALVEHRGIFPGDVIVSIDGVPVREPEDVTAYLRGDGRCLERYDVVVERDGAQKTLVYKVERRGSVSGRL